MPLPLLSQATELLIDDILPLLAVRDILALASTSKAFKALLLDTDAPDAELLWKRRIKQDLRFPVWGSIVLVDMLLSLRCGNADCLVSSRLRHNVTCLTAL